MLMRYRDPLSPCPVYPRPILSDIIGSLQFLQNLLQRLALLFERHPLTNQSCPMLFEGLLHGQHEMLSLCQLLSIRFDIIFDADDSELQALDVGLDRGNFDRKLSLAFFDLSKSIIRHEGCAYDGAENDDGFGVEPFREHDF